MFYYSIYFLILQYFSSIFSSFKLKYRTILFFQKIFGHKFSDQPISIEFFNYSILVIFIVLLHRQLTLFSTQLVVLLKKCFLGNEPSQTQNKKRQTDPFPPALFLKVFGSLGDFFKGRHPKGDMPPC